MADKITALEYQQNKELNTDDLQYTSILKRINEKRSLPNVKKVDRLGRMYLIYPTKEKKVSK